MSMLYNITLNNIDVSQFVNNVELQSDFVSYANILKFTLNSDLESFGLNINTEIEVIFYINNNIEFKGYIQNTNPDVTNIYFKSIDITAFSYPNKLNTNQIGPIDFGEYENTLDDQPFKNGNIFDLINKDAWYNCRFVHPYNAINIILEKYNLSKIDIASAPKIDDKDLYTPFFITPDTSAASTIRSIARAYSFFLFFDKNNNPRPVKDIYSIHSINPKVGVPSSNIIAHRETIIQEDIPNKVTIDRKTGMSISHPDTPNNDDTRNIQIPMVGILQGGNMPTDVSGRVWINRISRNNVWIHPSDDAILARGYTWMGNYYLSGNINEHSEDSIFVAESKSILRLWRDNEVSISYDMEHGISNSVDYIYPVTIKHKDGTSGIDYPTDVFFISERGTFSELQKLNLDIIHPNATSRSYGSFTRLSAFGGGTDIIPNSDSLDGALIISVGDESLLSDTINDIRRIENFGNARIFITGNNKERIYIFPRMDDGSDLVERAKNLQESYSILNSQYYLETDIGMDVGGSYQLISDSYFIISKEFNIINGFIKYRYYSIKLSQGDSIYILDDLSEQLLSKIRVSQQTSKYSTRQEYTATLVSPIPSVKRYNISNYIYGYPWYFTNYGTYVRVCIDPPQQNIRIVKTPSFCVGYVEGDELSLESIL